MRKLFAALAFVMVSNAATQAQIKLGGRAGGSETVEMNYTNPQKYEIGGITVSGVQFLDPNAIISVSGLKVGDEITVPGEAISGAIKKMWEQGILGDIEINVTRTDGKYIFLDYHLSERPRLSKFLFKGTKKGETTDLREKINLIRGRVVTDALIKNTKNTVQKFFTEKGYLHAAVNIEQIADSGRNSVTLRINVKKGRKVKISEIVFEDNQAFSDLQLRRKMKDTKVRRWYRIFKASKYQKSNFEKDKQSLIAYYNKNGYRDADITWDTLYPTKEYKEMVLVKTDSSVTPPKVTRKDTTIAANSHKRIVIKMKIEEGPKYYFRNITWVGNYIHDTKTLNSILGIKKGDVYNATTLDRKLTYNPEGYDVSSLYMDDGYLFFSVDPVEVAIVGDSIDIELRMNEGTQATINKINVAGNTKTNDHVVLREIYTLPGQKFSRADLIRTQRELGQLGYFDAEQIGIQPVPNPANGTVDINYTVVEKPSDQVELSGGWGGYYGFVGTLGLSFNNFSARKIFKKYEWQPLPQGDGQRLAIRFQANGRQFQNYSISFTEPWLGGRRPNSFTVSTNHSVQNYKSLGSGMLQITGISASLGKRLRWPDSYFTLMHSWGYQRYWLDNYSDRSLGFTNGHANSFNYTTTLSRNSINNPTFPTSGSTISLSVNLTPPYSLFRKNNNFSDDQERYKWVEFNKWMFDASWFTPLAKNLVINTRGHMGFIGSYKAGVGVGPFERFSVGGSGLTNFNYLLATDVIGLRGYDDNKITPQNATLPNGSEATRGIIYSKYVSELRYAISTNPAATIFVLGFLEAGNNWGSYRDYNPLNLYRSAGVGARIFMPAFGMIGVDYGWRFDSVPGTDMPKGQLHFTIGQQIR
ncbi:outer membrane protein assembly factor BamA [Flexibacter flexilis]|nr:outer membrane protein assembly factor BamA [Flexibacter flexilis]